LPAAVTRRPRGEAYISMAFYVSIRGWCVFAIVGGRDSCCGRIRSSQADSKRCHDISLAVYLTIPGPSRRAGDEFLACHVRRQHRRSNACWGLTALAAAFSFLLAIPTHGRCVRNMILPKLAPREINGRSWCGLIGDRIAVSVRTRYSLVAENVFKLRDPPGFTCSHGGAFVCTLGT